MKRKITLSVVHDPALVEEAKRLKRHVLVSDSGEGAVKGFCLKVTPAGNRSYILQYRTGGRGTPTKTHKLGDVAEFETPTEARQKAGKVKQQVRDGVDPNAARKQENPVRDVVKTFLAHYEQSKGRDAGETGRILNKIVIPAWGSRPMKAIGKSDVNRLLDSIMARGAPVMANRTRDAIQRLFKYAVQKDYAERNPAADIPRPATEQSRDRVLSDGELVEVWRAADAIGWPFGSAVQLLILSGQRRDEITGMAKAEIDRGKGLWSLPAERSKNGLPHDLHLTPQMLTILDKLPNTSKTLIFSTNGKTVISGWSKAKTQLDTKILEARQAAAKQTGEDPVDAAPMPHWTLHDLRRSMVTRLNELGVAEKVADILINHRSKKKGGVAAVYNRYQYMPERKAAIEVWNRHIDGLLTGTPPAENVVKLPTKAGRP